MTLKQSVDLIEYAILNGESGETIIPELISMKMIDLMEIFSEKYNKPIKVTSIRPGEKMLESLINPTQAGRLVKTNSYYHIKSIFDFKETIDDAKLIDYNSKINPLTKTELKKYLIDRKLI
jgi:FlaA1/EpsC-like NDP-sugar epimerase